MPLKGAASDWTLPATLAVSVLALPVEAAFRSERKDIHATLPLFSPPPSPLIPALPPAHFAPSPGAFTRARRSVRLRQAHPSEN